MMMMMKILLMFSLILTVCSIKRKKESIVSYPTNEKDAKRMMLEIKGAPTAENSKAIYTMLEKEHNKLKKDGYIFLGWRGFPPSDTQSVDDYLLHNNPKDNNFMDKFYNGKKWSGLWLATFVDVCYGYVEGLYAISNPNTFVPWIFRVYLKKSYIENINDVQMWQNGNSKLINPNPAPLKTAEYIYYGREDPSKTVLNGFEMVLSPAVAQKARFLLSTFSATGYTIRAGEIVKGNTNAEKLSLRAENRGELYRRTMINSGKKTAKQKLVESQNEFKP